MGEELLVRKISAIFLIIVAVLASVVTVAPVYAQPIEPITITSDFTFTGDIYQDIRVCANNIVIDGNGYTIQGPGGEGGCALYMYEGYNIVIKNIKFKNWGCGIYTYRSQNIEVRDCVFVECARGIDMEGYTSHCTIIENTFISSSIYGVWLSEAVENLVTKNTFVDNFFGVLLSWADNNVVSENNLNSSYCDIHVQYSCSYNEIWGNTLTSDVNCIFVQGSGKNLIYHNNILGNYPELTDCGENFWYHPDLLEGNYWIDYPGIDDGSGSGKHAIANDGIGDTNIPYPIIPWPGIGLDYYPLTNIWSLDQQAPTIVIESPAEYGIYATNSGAKFSFSVSDNLDSSPDAAATVTGWDSSFPISSGDDLPSESGAYTLSVTATDNAGNTATKSLIFVVYDPSAGFVTGGGWIQSPQGAYTTDPALLGKGSFGFVSKYQKGANIPVGNTEFIFHVADFQFKSISYDWLVVAGIKAQFKGSGTINGIGEYKFMLTAEDAGDNGADTFRIKIWNAATETVVYDNGAQSTLGGGNIIIHK